MLGRQMARRGAKTRHRQLPSISRRPNNEKCSIKCQNLPLYASSLCLPQRPRLPRWCPFFLDQYHRSTTVEADESPHMVEITTMESQLWPEEGFHGQPACVGFGLVFKAICVDLTNPSRSSKTRWWYIGYLAADSLSYPLIAQHMICTD